MGVSESKKGCLFFISDNSNTKVKVIKTNTQHKYLENLNQWIKKKY